MYYEQKKFESLKGQKHIMLDKSMSRAPYATNPPYRNGGRVWPVPCLNIHRYSRHNRNTRAGRPSI